MQTQQEGGQEKEPLLLIPKPLSCYQLVSQDHQQLMLLQPKMDNAKAQLISLRSDVIRKDTLRSLGFILVLILSNLHYPHFDDHGISELLFIMLGVLVSLHELTFKTSKPFETKQL